ncbi:MAG: MBL fold metallo-hydrolase, partial [Bacteroidales bacterium]|nr:MBL fold metallo-hydrolase [Bacteroidales bacterium]
MEFSLLTLGTASALPTANRYPSAHILTVRERLFLIDCGEGTQMQLRRAGISFSKIDHIFISHLHGDHTYGLFGLLSTISMSNRTTPLYIYAPEGFKAFLDFFMSQFGEGVKYPITHIVVKCSQPIEILRTKQVTVEAFPLVHRTETYGFLFKEAEPQVNVHKHLIEPNNLSLYEIARLKEGLDIVRDASFVDEDGKIVEYKETLLCKDFTYKPYVPRSFAYCTDTMYFKRLSKWIEN